MLMFSSCNSKLFAVRHIHYPVNPSNAYFHTDAVGLHLVPSSDHRHLVIITASRQCRHLVIITELRNYRHLVITYSLKERNNVN